MKVRITDPEIIRKREKELFEAISENLDWEAVSKVFRLRHRLGSITGMASREGDFVARDGAVAYRLDFDVRAVVSVVFDRSGNYLAPGDELGLPQNATAGKSAQAVSIPEPPRPDGWGAFSPESGEEAEEEEETIALDQIVRSRSDMIQEPGGASRPRGAKTHPNVKMSRIANELADMISDINGKKEP
jgi:hypothetical protein